MEPTEPAGDREEAPGGESALHRRNSQLEESNRRYQDLLDFMTHELQNPLSMIRANSELLVQGDGGRLTSKGKRLATNLWRSANRIEHLISTYLQLSSIEGGRHVLRPERCLLLGSIVKEATEFLSIQLEANGTTVEIDEGGLPEAEVVVDRELMQSAIQNVMSNAVKYGLKGSRITVRASRAGDATLVSFFNEGVGIPNGQIEDVFIKYHRVQSGADNQFRSSGIGLYLVRRIMQEHGGRVWMESEEGRWARVTLEIPDRAP